MDLNHRVYMQSTAQIDKIFFANHITFLTFRITNVQLRAPKTVGWGVAALTVSPLHMTMANYKHNRPTKSSIVTGHCYVH